MNTIKAQAVYWDHATHGVCEASDLGLAPGKWPEQIEVEFPDTGTLSLSIIWHSPS